MSADKLVEDSSNASHDINQLPFSTTGGKTYTFSIFVKTDTRSKIRIGYGALVNFDAFGGDVFAIIDVSNKSVISSILSPTILFSDFENGYVKVTFLKQATGNGQFNLIFGLVNNSNAASYSGDGSSGLFIWGAQLEEGAYPTSYIPTLASSVTRLADAAFKTGISSLIGQTEGTLFAEYKVDGISVSARIISVSDGTNANRIVLLVDGASIRIFVSTASVGQVDISFGTFVGSHKIAVAYANNDLVVFLDGVLVATDTSISVPACSSAQVGTLEDNTNATPLGGGVKQAILFKTRLTNTQLASLTTL